MYIIVKQFELGGKTFYKDKLVDPDTFSESHIKRLAANGYISSLQLHEPPPHYEQTDEFLTPDKVNKLKKPDLIGYALYIGVEDFDTGAKIEVQREMVNAFIANKDENKNGEV